MLYMQIKKGNVSHCESHAGDGDDAHACVCASSLSSSFWLLPLLPTHHQNYYDDAFAFYPSCVSCVTVLYQACCNRWRARRGLTESSILYHQCWIIRTLLLHLWAVSTARITVVHKTKVSRLDMCPKCWPITAWREESTLRAKDSSDYQSLTASAFPLSDCLFSFSCTMGSVCLNTHTYIKHCKIL